MPNSYFRFRRFTVWQDRCAMKVCTDACLFGAWLANEVHDAVHVLDIGTGTGLLSLMFAQNSSASVNALEIDKDASVQAAENFNSSPWAYRLKVIDKSVQDYTAAFPGTSLYDLVFSNPPFYSNDLKSSDSRRNLAQHSEALSLEELVYCTS
ncbi:MAG: methyltransferase, partial [Chitinophagaceae bacterium]|nr:methyltransferase [Chitinophagaceae bacterium]